jgi:putative ATPase
MYWLAKMLVGGEDPRFVARRLVILASEDVGLADPHALLIAVAAHHAVEFVGLPEAELTLAHATLYIATAPKSNSATLALGEARRVLAEQPVQSVPDHLRDKGGQASKRLSKGKEAYAYSHEFAENVSGQDYLRKPLKLYTPGGAGAESAIGERLAHWKGLKASLRSGKELADGGINP